MCGACSRSSGWKIATFKYKRSTRSTPPQLRLENRSFWVRAWNAGRAPAAPVGHTSSQVDALLGDYRTASAQDALLAYRTGPDQDVSTTNTDVVRGAHSRGSGWTIATFKYKRSTRSTPPQLRQHLRRATCAESLAQGNLRSANCTEHLHKALAQSTLHRPTCTEHMRKALARSNWRRALAQSNLLRALAQSNLHRALARSNVQRATCPSAEEKKRAGSLRLL